MTLWPISMFSRILASPSRAAPATHAGFRVRRERVPASSATRPAAARPRWTLIIRLMYAASAAPRDSSMSARMASSSQPICSTSSSVRWVYSLTSEMAIRFLSVIECRERASGVSRSDVEGAGAHRSGDAGLHLFVGLGVLVAVAQVADPAVDEGERAGVADAHPAAVRHAHAGGLARLEDGRRAVGLDGLPGRAEGDRAALATFAAQLEGEPLQVEPVPQAGGLVVLRDRVEH